MPPDPTSETGGHGNNILVDLRVLELALLDPPEVGGNEFFLMRSNDKIRVA